MDDYLIIVTQNGRKVAECPAQDITDKKGFSEIMTLTGRDWYIVPVKEKRKWNVTESESR